MYVETDDKPYAIFQHKIPNIKPSQDIFAIIDFSGTQYKVQKV